MKKLAIAAAAAAFVATSSLAQDAEVVIIERPAQLPAAENGAIAFGGCTAGLGAFAAAAGAAFPIALPAVAVGAILCTIVVGQELEAR